MPIRICGECGSQYTAGGTESSCPSCVHEGKNLVTIPQEGEGNLPTERVRITPTIRKSSGSRVAWNPARYNQLLKKQGGVCAICRQPETLCDEHGNSMKLTLYVHRATDTIVGLICRACQTGLLWFRDSQALLASAIAFLAQGAGPTTTVTGRAIGFEGG